MESAMKRGTTVALGVAGGYLLGRFRKARWLLMTAAAVAASKRSGGGMLQRGAETLKSSPEIGKLAEQGRDAAAAVLGRRMEGLTDKVHSVTERVRPLQEVGRKAEAAAAGEERGGERAGEEEAEEGPEDEQALESEEEEEGGEEEEEEGEEEGEEGLEGEQAREGEGTRQGEEQPGRGQAAGQRGTGRPSGQQRPLRTPRPGSRRPGAERTERQDRRADPTSRRTGPSRIRR
jgi:hypothetical protein